MKNFLLGGLALLISSGCSRPHDARHPEDSAATESGGRHEPKTDEERKLLARVAVLPTNVREKVGRKTVSASEPYQAASGYSCRNVTIERGGEQSRRLACGDKSGWFFVPDIFHQGESVDVPSEPVVQVSATGEAEAVDSPRSSGPGGNEAGRPEEEGL